MLSISRLRAKPRSREYRSRSLRRKFREGRTSSRDWRNDENLPPPERAFSSAIRRMRKTVHRRNIPGLYEPSRAITVPAIIKFPRGSSIRRVRSVLFCFFLSLFHIQIAQYRYLSYYASPATSLKCVKLGERARDIESQSLFYVLRSRTMK